MLQNPHFSCTNLILHLHESAQYCTFCVELHTKNWSHPLGLLRKPLRKVMLPRSECTWMVSRQQWRIQKFWKGRGGRQFIIPRPHLSQMHTTNYMPFTWKKAAFWKKILSQ